MVPARPGVGGLSAQETLQRAGGEAGAVVPSLSSVSLSSGISGCYPEAGVARAQGVSVGGGQGPKRPVISGGGTAETEKNPGKAPETSRRATREPKFPQR
jgi:hypothetical protein